MTSPRPVIVRPLARRDIARAARWYERQSDGLGSRFVAAVDVALAAAGADPERYRAVYRDVRRVRVDVFPYGASFVVRAGAVQVLAVTHPRRHPRCVTPRAAHPLANEALQLSDTPGRARPAFRRRRTATHDAP